MHALSSELVPSGPALTLPPRLQQLLAALPDRYLAERLARVWSAAREALEEVERLVLAPEGLDEPGADPARLSPWEHVAPAVRDTLAALQRLLARVRMDFPTQPPEDYTASDGAPIVRAQPAEQAALSLGLAAARLGARAQVLGERLRRPERDGEPQELARELREVHHDLRAELRDLVLRSAQAFAPVGRDALPLVQAPASAVRLVRPLPDALTGGD
ncbi:hypothetical protein FGE12_11670 [Aggregicoccus sp. 17bor-14]|uniref:hypothetical protein n=1 Tax=Myxococcaceae TaxID=31 RepID=UPI00129C8644|nr:MULTISPECIES: hypothetical protein [Myxococcaceae]MBF5043046.1 hypothetical protein [Simulacricoccus sp. 17bor-14]MRI88809.1 hypothetical protein [Aggregicoccus sp. 17bor-14]